jgi:hypothetical protein
VSQEIYRQQQEMWKEKKPRVDHRIVSLNQPHVRPIVRGKARKSILCMLISLFSGSSRVVMIF